MGQEEGVEQPPSVYMLLGAQSAASTPKLPSWRGGQRASVVIAPRETYRERVEAWAVGMGKSAAMLGCSGRVSW